MTSLFSHLRRTRTTHTRRRQRPLLLERLEDRVVPTLMLSLLEAGVNGGANVVVSTAPDFTAASFTGIYGDFTVRSLGSASDNGAASSDLLSSTTSVRNNGASTLTLYLTAFQDNYTLPAGSPLAVESGLGGSVNFGNLSLSNIFQAYASSTNNTTFDFTNGPQTAVQTGTTFDTGSATGSFSRVVGNPYSVSTTATITLSAGGTVNFSSHVTLKAAPNPQIQIVKLTNGTNNDNPPTPGVPDGPIVPVGSTVTWTYNVTNPGNEPIANVNVTDNIAGVNPTTVFGDGAPGHGDAAHNTGDANNNNLLDPGEQWVFQASGTAVAGQYSNVGTVTGTSTVSNTPVSASNPDHYFGATPSVQIVKLTNGTNNDNPPVAGVPDGPTVPVGSTVTWTYNVTNPASDPFSLTSVQVTDNIAGVNPMPVLSGGFNVGDSNHNGLLDPGETWQFTASGTAIAGQYSNIGTVVATPSDSQGNTFPGAGTVTANNPDHYFGTLSLGDFVWNDTNANGIQDSNDLSSNGINGVTVDLLNSQNVQIANTATTNNPVGGAPGYYQFTGLAPGSYTVVIDSSNFASGGPLFGFQATPSNAPGSTTANDSNGSPAPVTLTTANDETIDFGFFKPAINIVKLTNGTNNDSPPVAGVPDGPIVPVGSTVTWTYNVTNPTSVALSSVSVTDNIAGVSPTPVLSGGFNVGDTNHDGLLENGETWVFTASGTAIAGQYSNIGTATGTPVTPTGGTIPGATPMTATNPDHYFGQTVTGTPDLAITKTSDSAAVVAGKPIGFVVTITNTGTADATGVQLNDPLPGFGDLVWSIASQSDSNNSGITFAISGAQGKQVLTLTNNGSVTLHAGEVLTVHITSPTTAADTTGTSISAAPSWLGAAGDYAILYTGTGGHNLSITNITAHGNVGVGGTGVVQFSGPGTIGGRLDFAAASTGQNHNTNGSNVGPTSVNFGVSPVTTALNTVTTLSSSLAGLGNSITINGTQTINASDGQAVTLGGVNYRIFKVTSYSENDGKLVTINDDVVGDPVVVFNFGFSSNVNLGGDVALTGGLTDDQVVWNFTSSGKNVSLNNNASSFPTLDFHGIILAPNDAISLVNANLNGRVFGGNSSDMQIVSGDSIRAPLLNTATVTASNVPFDTDDTATATVSITKSTPLGSGQTATLGFWKNAGQSVILNFNGGPTSTALGTWLNTNFPNLFGSFNGQTNTYVASQFKNGATNTYLQAFGVALDIYATTTSLGGASVISGGFTTKYGFKVSDAGDLYATWDVGSAAAAFDIPAGGSTVLTLPQILKIADSHYSPVTGQFYGGDSTRTDQLNTTLNNINEKADIKLTAASASGIATVGTSVLVGSISDLQTGTVLVSVDTLEGAQAADEQARIDDAIASLNSSLGAFGITLVEVGADQADSATIHVHLADTTSNGGVDQGVLGLTEFGGEVTIVTGWNYYLGADATAVGANQYDFQSVVTHELGHAIGFGHSTDSNSVMFPFLGTGMTHRFMTANDVTVIEGAATAPEPLMAAPGSSGFASMVTSVTPAVIRVQTPATLRPTAFDRLFTLDGGASLALFSFEKRGDFAPLAATSANSSTSRDRAVLDQVFQKADITHDSLVPMRTSSDTIWGAADSTSPDDMDGYFGGDSLDIGDLCDATAVTEPRPVQSDELS
jgi:uncharacterized repeat protein (TIGR01451 family)